jgi:DNA-binding NtrC family response regulator
MAQVPSPLSLNNPALHCIRMLPPSQPSILIEDDYPCTKDAYQKLVSTLVPTSTVVLSNSPQQTHNLCSSTTFDVVIVDHKGPALGKDIAKLLEVLPSKTSTILITGLREDELRVQACPPRFFVLEKPITVEALATALKSPC